MNVWKSGLLLKFAGVGGQCLVFGVVMWVNSGFSWLALSEKRNTVT